MGRYRFCDKCKKQAASTTYLQEVEIGHEMYFELCGDCYTDFTKRTRAWLDG